MMLRENKKWVGVSFVIAFLMTSLMMSGSIAIAQEKIVSKVWTWMSPGIGETFAEELEWRENAFEKQHPNVDLQFQFVPFGLYSEKFMSAVATGDVPDALEVSINWARDWWKAGALLRLNDYIAKTPEVSEDKFMDSALRFGRIEGDVYGLPWSYSAQILIYNIGKLEEAGLGTNVWDTIQTWDDLVRYAEKLTVRDVEGNIIEPGFYNPQTNSNFPAWLATNNASFYNEDKTGSGFDTPEGLETAQFLYDLVHKYKVGLEPQPREYRDVNYFLAENRSILVGIVFSCQLIYHRNPEIEFRITPFPKGPSGKGRSAIDIANVQAIPAKAKNPDIGWEYLRFTCGQEVQLKKMELIQDPSPRKDVYLMPEFKEIGEKYPWLKTTREIGKIGVTCPRVKVNEIWELTEMWFYKIMKKQVSVKEGLKEAAKAMDEVLTREEW